MCGECAVRGAVYGDVEKTYEPLAVPGNREMKLDDILIIAGVIVVPLLCGILFAAAALESATEREELVFLSGGFGVAAALGLITTGVLLRKRK